MEHSTDTLFDKGFAILIVGMIVAALFIAIFLINSFIPFMEERDYIKSEMARSFDEDEYRYWQKELRRLYLRSIPLIGKFFR